MPVTYKILGQVGSALVETDLYSVPGGSSAIVSSLTVTNRGANLAGFRISISQAGTTPTTDKDYLYYDVAIGGNDTFIATVGLTLEATDVIRVKAGGTGASDLTFQAFGSEIS